MDENEKKDWRERLEEFGELHTIGCALMNEEPMECDCLGARQMAMFVEELLSMKAKAIEEGIRKQDKEQNGISTTWCVMIVRNELR